MNTPTTPGVSVTHKIFDTPQGVTEVILSGNFSERENPPVIMIPGLSRDPSDFTIISEILVQEGWCTAAVYSRGSGKSAGETEGITLHNLAGDVISIIEQLDAESAIVVGHAFGNRVARCLSADRPEKVACLILLAAGGKVGATEKAMEATKKLWTRPSGDISDESLAENIHKQMKIAYFAEKSDPAAWMTGTWPAAGGIGRTAVMATPLDEWWHGGSAPMLVIQGAEDITAPPENGILLKQEYGDRVTLVDIEDAAHALVVENPRKIAEVMLEYLRGY
jgi:pimeloyl-ACP methyl ester carboxylesterase